MSLRSIESLYSTLNNAGYTSLFKFYRLTQDGYDELGELKGSLQQIYTTNPDYFGKIYTEKSTQKNIYLPTNKIGYTVLQVGDIVCEVKKKRAFIPYNEEPIYNLDTSIAEIFSITETCDYTTIYDISGEYIIDKNKGLISSKNNTRWFCPSYTEAANFISNCVFENTGYDSETKVFCLEDGKTEGTIRTPVYIPLYKDIEREFIIDTQIYGGTSISINIYEAQTDTLIAYIEPSEGYNKNFYSFTTYPDYGYYLLISLSRIEAGGYSPYIQGIPVLTLYGASCIITYTPMFYQIEKIHDDTTVSGYFEASLKPYGLNISRGGS